ncbi:TetR/AcrR family transcriptional regulator [uncultured Kiloniella sp.]|uniref:TetR/AcrR family transcriptional regulator n=1 Tax=uncultured Kiloniella sp. TaxID=1133091 RepID=UPI00260D227E|nr:TetR/AcrR family transcriptional regulator [uncultured Kiloniella sp.]
MTVTNKKRGRPRGFDKNQAQEIALQLFWKDGYEATGLSKLTKAIGVGAPSLYAAFGSKAQLFEKAVNLYQAQCTPFFQEAFAADNLTDFVHLLFGSAVKSYTQENAGRGCLVLDGTRNASDPEALKITQKIRENFHRQLVEKLTQLGAEEPAQTADVCQTTMTGLSGAARHGLPRDKMHDVAQTLASGICAKS